MSERHFNEEEKDLLRKYQGLSTSSLGGRVAFEIVAPLVFVAAWLYTGRAIYLLALIVALVFRALKQHKTLRKLSSISKKVIGEVDKQEVPPTTDHAA